MVESFLATDQEEGFLNEIPGCKITTPDEIITLKALPEISESKSVIYADQPIQGRAAPVKTYAYSENRTISLTIHLYVSIRDDIKLNMRYIRAISALAHPEYGGTYNPPQIAQIKCAHLDDVPVVLKSYQLQYDNTVQWFNEGDIYMPLHLSIQTEWDVVYSHVSLPGHADVIRGAY